jgi:3'(2'), 5'-bisphosphate nucleotidase
MALLSPEDQFACECIRTVGKLVRRVQAEMVTGPLTKGDNSPVTVGDFAAQAVVAKLLGDYLPGSVLVGEEDAKSLRDSAAAEMLELVTRFVQYVLPAATPEVVCDWIDAGNGLAEGTFWTLDPIDGTKGFLRGEQYAVAFAKIVDGQVQRGYLACPELADGGVPAIGGPGSLLWAVRGGGAWIEPLAESVPAPTRARVSPVGDLADVRVFRSVETSHTNTGQLGEFCRALGTSAEAIPMDSQAKYAALAAGQGEMLVRFLSANRPDYREKIWDQAAGSIVIEEAGGRVTDLDGQPLDFSQGSSLAANRGVLATNGVIHEAALAAIRAIGA